MTPLHTQPDLAETPETSIAAADYISELAAQLATLAEHHDLRPTAHLLRFAAIEAALTSRR